MGEPRSAQTAEQQKSGKVPHSLILENRRSMTATGVSNVDSFDEETVIIVTDLGNLTVRGSKLHIDKFSLETGELTLDGEISSMTYTENRSSGGGVFSRLFK